MTGTNGTKLKRTEQAILDLLSDGLPHTYQEIHGCLWDELSELMTIKQHISNLRKHLNPKGVDILCVWAGRKRQYRMVRLLASVNE